MKISREWAAEMRAFCDGDNIVCRWELPTSEDDDNKHSYEGRIETLRFPLADNDDTIAMDFYRAARMLRAAAAVCEAQGQMIEAHEETFRDDEESGEYRCCPGEVESDDDHDEDDE